MKLGRATWLVLAVAVALMPQNAVAATITFNDVAIGPLTKPGSFASGGITLELSGPGGAFVETSPNPPDQWLRLNESAAMSVDVPPGTTAGTFIIYHLSLGSLAINGESLDFFMPPMTGTVGGVAYDWQLLSDTRFVQFNLSGPIGTLDFVAGPSLNALLVDEITLVPEPSGGILLLLAVATVGGAGWHRRGKRRSHRLAP